MYTFVIPTTPQVNSNQWEGLPPQAPGGRVMAAEVPIGLQRQTVAAHAPCSLALPLSQVHRLARETLPVPRLGI